MTVDASWPGAYYTSVDCNPLTPLLRFVLDLLYNLLLHSCAADDKILTDTARSRAFCLRNLVGIRGAKSGFIHTVNHAKLKT